MTQELYSSFAQTSVNTTDKYLLIFKTCYTNESFFFWTLEKVNFSVVNGFDLGVAVF